jgi:hypothetical protein
MIYAYKNFDQAALVNEHKWNHKWRPGSGIWQLAELKQGERVGAKIIFDR